MTDWRGVLIPVGDVMQVVYPPSNRHAMNYGLSAGATTGSSGNNFTIWQYRVTAHREGNEVLEPIDKREVAPARWDSYCGMLLPVAPEELRGLVDPSWFEPIKGA